ncbi:MAG TPA: Nramp family divalent metal transporter [Methylomirabilota bacterium]|nr:Nramp family divalent metal transporter [Methylomirabilota bacterium]
MNDLPAWRQGDLPHAPAYNPVNLVRVIGPGAILLGLSLGAGDWLLGPAIAAGYGPSLLWICTLSILFQGVLNTEMARYTLATGEPVFTGFMRQRPGPRTWAVVYSLLHLAQVGWAGWALAGGSALAALLLGRMPREEDRAITVGLGYLLFLAAVGLVLAGRHLHRALEIVEWIMMGWMLLFLAALALLYVPRPVWVALGGGFVGRPLWEPGWLPAPPPDRPLDWLLVAGFAAYSGAGGTVNAMLTYWLRDKGFGMAGTVGVQPISVGAQILLLPREGAIFPPSEANLAKWREWWRYLRADLFWLWTVVCLIGMALPVALALDAVPRTTDVSGLGAGAVFARELARRYGAVLWMPALLTALWIFFSTQVGIAEGFARHVTEMLWTAGARPGARGPVWLFYPVLALFVAAGGLAMTRAAPLTLILIGANVAALNFAVLSFHTLRLNRALLPEPLRPPRWREAVVALGGLAFALLVARVLARLLLGL